MSIPPGFLEHASQPFRTVWRGPGELIQEAGHRVESLWLLLEGRVLLHGGTESGRPFACSCAGPSSLIGLEGLSSTPALRDALVMEGARFAVASIESVKAWTTDGTGASSLLPLVVEEALRSVAERSIPVGSARTRLARFLLARQRDPRLAAWDGVPLVDVACLLAIRPETLSRSLHDLERRGVVSARHARVQVLDEAALRKLADEA